MSQNSKKISTEPYKGVRDFYPKDQFFQNYLQTIWRKACQSFGYEEYDASILEPTELYRAKTGDEIVNEQTYSFIDRGEREVTLRPEMTPTVARMVAGKRRELYFPLRLYSIPNVFRYERPQKGRLREHRQLNVDIFGEKSSQADLELIKLAVAILKAFGATESQFQVRVSSRKLLNSIFGNWYQLDEERSKAIQKLIDKKNKISQEDFDAEAEKITGKPFTFLNLSNSGKAGTDSQTETDGQDNADYDAAMAIPEIKEAKEEMDAFIQELNNAGINNVIYDETLVRGFDYYTGLVFEIYDTDPENARAIFGGGRFDNLLDIFDEPDMACTGFGMGDVRLLDFLETHNLLPKYIPAAKIMICPINAEAFDYANTVAGELRTQGKNVAVNYSLKNIGDQIKCAVKAEIPYAIIIGDDETKSKTYKIKNLATGDLTDKI